jgi:hypothetical protein
MVIRIRKSKNRELNGQKKKDKNDKQRSTKHTYKTKDRVTRTPLKTGVNSGAPLVTPVVLTYVLFVSTDLLMINKLLKCSMPV